MLPVFLLSAFLALPCKAQDPDFVSKASHSFKKGTLHLKAVKLDTTKHKITRCDHSAFNDSTVCAIDGTPVYGTSPPYQLPDTKLKKATLEISGQRISLEVSGMFNPWHRKPGDNFSISDHHRGQYVVRGLFSDAAGTYAAEWIVVDGKATRTILSDLEAITVGLFTREALENEEKK